MRFSESGRLLFSELRTKNFSVPFRGKNVLAVSWPLEAGSWQLAAEI